MLTKPAPKVSHSLKDVKAVQDHYESPKISIYCPGVKDTVSLRTGTERKTKHLMIVEVKEVYSHYCQKHPNSRTGLFSFAVLCPK